MKQLLIIPTLLLAWPATADDNPDPTYYVMPQIPSEADKISALKAAYVINGNSMSGRTVDLTLPVTGVVRTKKIAPAETKNEIDETADLNMEDLRKFSRRANMKTDICARHHMHKVVRGDSWRCRK